MRAKTVDTQMKVLIVSPIPTDPLVAGNRARIAALFRALVRLGHDVTFAYVPIHDAPYDKTRQPHPPADYDKMRQRLGDRLRILHAAWPFQSIVAKLQREVKRRFRFKSAHSWRVDDWFDEGLVPQLRRLQARESFDCVLIEYVYLSKIASVLPPPVRTIIDTHDLFGDRHTRCLDSGSRPHGFTTTVAEETSALNRADAVIAIQQEEAEYLRRTISSEVFTVGHLIDVSPLPDPGGARMLFVGSSNTPSNIEGLEWFLDRVFPRIRKEMPDVELAIAGPVGHERTWPNGISVLGIQESLTPAYADATLVINPVLFGTGVAIKTIEALSYGKPVVATPAGIRGLKADFHGAFLLAETPDAFVEHVLELLENGAARSAMSHQAIAASGEWQRRQLTMLNAAIAGKQPR
jgi:glycosyltransferase involved in cell wall biosynthesis